MAMTQGEAVFQAVCKALESDEFDYKVVDSISESKLKQIHELVFQAFITGQTSHSKNPTPEQLKKYIPGLVNNWLRKDTRLNGGNKYMAKNPGSRSGSGDESVKAMRTLLSVTSDPSAKQAIQAEIDKRVAALKAANAPTIDASKLPESLRHLLKS